MSILKFGCNLISSLLKSGSLRNTYPFHNRFFYLGDMSNLDFIKVVIAVLFSSSMLVTGLYLLSRFNRLFLRYIKNELLRKNIAVSVISICLMLAVAPTSFEFYVALSKKKLHIYYPFECVCAILGSLFVFNISRLVVKYLDDKKLSFRKRMAIVLATIIVFVIFLSTHTNYP